MNTKGLAALNYMLLELSSNDGLVGLSDNRDTFERKEKEEGGEEENERKKGCGKERVVVVGVVRYRRDEDQVR